MTRQVQENTARSACPPPYDYPGAEPVVSPNICQDCADRHYPRRFIICVDGPKPPVGSSQTAVANPLTGGLSDNVSIYKPSSMYRTYRAIKSGITRDEVSGRIFEQIPIYFHSTGVEDSAWDTLMTAGRTGPPRTQKETEIIMRSTIKNVYKHICERYCFNQDGSQDEITFFGYSTGAFIVRAVASLLHQLNLIAKEFLTDDEMNFTKVFEDGWKIFVDRSSDVTSLAQYEREHFLQTKTRQLKSPPIPFMGLIETVEVKSFNSASILAHVSENVRFAYQALAINEDRPAIREIPLEACLSQSRLQVWFFGRHEDLGGVSKEDGLSFWPLQWLLAEARQNGTALINVEIDADSDILREPAEVHKETFKLLGFDGQEHGVHYENGIKLNVWDIRPTLNQNDHEAKLPYLTSGSLARTFRGRNRETFDISGGLVNYSSEKIGIRGTVLHPSLFYHLDITSDHSEWGPYGLQIENFRKNYINHQSTKFFWEEEESKKPEKFRVLICGNTKVGKSTLINKVFGIQLAEVNAARQTSHDVTAEIQGAVNGGNSPIIIHDSKGFESGDESKGQEILQFLEERANSGDLNKRVHCIWYCIDSSNRVTDKILLTILKQNFTKWKIPIVIVYTKFMSHDSALKLELEQEYMEEHDDRPSSEVLEALFWKVRKTIQNSQDSHIMEVFEKCQPASGTAPAEAAPRELDIGRHFQTQRVDKFDIPSRRILIEKTIDMVDANVEELFIAAQTVSHDLKIKAAVRSGLRLIEGGPEKILLFRTVTRRFFRNEIRKEIVVALLKIFSWNIDPAVSRKVLENPDGFSEATVITMATSTAASVGYSGILLAEGAAEIVAGGASVAGGVAFAGLLGVAAPLGYFGLKVQQLRSWVFFLVCTILVMHKASMKVQARKPPNNKVRSDDFVGARLKAETLSSLKKDTEDMLPLSDCFIVNYSELEAKTLKIVQTYQAREDYVP